MKRIINGMFQIKRHTNAYTNLRDACRDSILSRNATSKYIQRYSINEKRKQIENLKKQI